MILIAIAVCEIAFWAFLGTGLAARYLAGRPRLGAALLFASPLSDVVLLGLTAIDLRAGTAPSNAHLLAAAYLGFSVAFGHGVIRWADQQFAYRFGGGPPPVKSPRTGSDKMRHEWREFGKATLAWAISGSVLIGLAALNEEPARAVPLLHFTGVLTIVLGVWFVTGPLPATIRAAHQRKDEHPPWPRSRCSSPC